MMILAKKKKKKKGQGKKFPREVTILYQTSSRSQLANEGAGLRPEDVKSKPVGSWRYVLGRVAL